MAILGSQSTPTHAQPRAHARAHAKQLRAHARAHALVPGNKNNRIFTIKQGKNGLFGSAWYELCLAWFSFDLCGGVVLAWNLTAGIFWILKSPFYRNYSYSPMYQGLLRGFSL